jgi:hypothetical protein
MTEIKMVGQPTLFYGTCTGGPFHAKQIAHGEKRLTIFLEPAGRRWATIPGMVKPSIHDPDLRHGFYDFDEKTSHWCWSEVE